MKMIFLAVFLISAFAQAKSQYEEISGKDMEAYKYAVLEDMEKPNYDRILPKDCVRQDIGKFTTHELIAGATEMYGKGERGKFSAIFFIMHFKHNSGYYFRIVTKVEISDYDNRIFFVKSTKEIWRKTNVGTLASPVIKEDFVEDGICSRYGKALPIIIDDGMNLLNL